ncbi:uncharacterized protein J4E88_008924 [Alternaria novae-zelandiae]|uniref:uncharacterized protein n=1 Tax=Alternaria novae-zelandiae TaxID=430562 RepID=UPI0020C31EC8|nr:uncharacterized protein J4E88_008924 [Alternaria novae-zelandiae]KAI4673311.1 hypothetical protein J4E88_008924 [Alternaria novae-zelandiae]
MSYEHPLPMPGAWPSDDTNPTSPLTFTLSNFISAAGIAQTYIETTLQQSKSLVWLSEIMTNMTLFTYAEELVEKSVASRLRWPMGSYCLILWRKWGYFGRYYGIRGKLD